MPALLIEIVISIPFQNFVAFVVRFLAQKRRTFHRLYYRGRVYLIPLPAVDACRSTKIWHQVLRCQVSSVLLGRTAISLNCKL